MNGCDPRAGSPCDGLLAIGTAVTLHIRARLAPFLTPIVAAVRAFPLTIVLDLGERLVRPTGIHDTYPGFLDLGGASWPKWLRS